MVSAGEQKVIEILSQLQLSYQHQYRILEVKKRTYDFMFAWNQQNYIIEVDGAQHFKDIEHFKSTAKEQHINDIIKQILALHYGFKVIRIHYKDIDNFYHHLVMALSHLELHKVYYSSPEHYTWMSEVYATVILTKKGTMRQQYIKRYIKKRYVYDLDRNIILSYH
jgi:very-short-patch-repair endonuclease